MIKNSREGPYFLALISFLNKFSENYTRGGPILFLPRPLPYPLFESLYVVMFPKTLAHIEDLDLR